jgi:hypothetical protein
LLILLTLFVFFSFIAGCRFQKIFESTDERKRIEELASLSKDFNHTARTYGQIIIAERYLPVSKKTIKPMDIGGIAGGQKYIVQGKKKSLQNKKKKKKPCTIDTTKK